MLIVVHLSFSQDARLFENDWYLTNIIVNGVNNLPPNEGMNLYFNSTTFLSAYACNTMYANVSFEDNNTNFSASNYVYTLDFCTNQLAANYQKIYFGFFHDGTNSNPLAVYNFTYTISESFGVKTLTINSMYNQQAIYSSVILSNPKFKQIDFSLSPNPSKDYLEINLKNEFSENTFLEFYNEIGQICKTVILKYDTKKIEINDLSNGIYFVKIKTKNETITKKFVKI